MEEGLIIRTMKDDVADFHGPTEGSVYDSVKIPQQKHASRVARSSIVGIIVVFLIGLGGWLSYQRIMSGLSSPPSVEVSNTIEEIIPKNVQSILVLNIGSAVNRSTLQSSWQGVIGTLSSITDIDKAYVFTLPHNTKPFIVIKNTLGTKQFVSQQRAEQVLDQGGWYVMHAVSLQDYSDALVGGSIAGTPMASTLDEGDMLARYIINGAELSSVFSLNQQFIHKDQQFVYDFSGIAEQDAIQANFKLSEAPILPKVVPDVSGLLSLIPSDVTFLKVGQDFAVDLPLWQSKNGALDQTIFSEATIQQFIARFHTPYAIFTRTGADGVSDIGCVVELPDSLKKELKNANPVVEQLLTSLAPFITGKPLSSQIVFADSLFRGIPIRYTNLEGQSSALDYSIGDNFILFSTSREGMTTLADTTLLNSSSFGASAIYGQLQQRAKQLAPYNMIVSSIKDPSFASLIPGGKVGMPIIVSTTQDNTGITNRATVVLTK